MFFFLAVNTIFKFLMRGQSQLDAAEVNEDSEHEAVVKYLKAVYNAKHNTDEQSVAASIEKHKLKPKQVATTMMQSKEVSLK